MLIPHAQNPNKCWIKFIYFYFYFSNQKARMNTLSYAEYRSQRKLEEWWANCPLAAIPRPPRVPGCSSDLSSGCSTLLQQFFCLPTCVHGSWPPKAFKKIPSICQLSKRPNRVDSSTLSPINSQVFLALEPNALIFYKMFTEHSNWLPQIHSWCRPL